MRPVHIVPLNVRIEDSNFILLQGVVESKFKLVGCVLVIALGS